MTNVHKRPKILISTGIYPPDIGGPALYAKRLKEEFKAMGLKTKVRSYRKMERILPTGFRHIYYFFKIIPKVLKSDLLIILDTFSVALPTVLAGKMFGKKMIIRTGGDFLHELYLERTKKLVPLDFFYKESKRFFFKERIIFKLTKFVLKNVDAIVFSSDYQKEIFEREYGLSGKKLFVIENFYGPKIGNTTWSKKNFVWATRDLVFKNKDLGKRAFDEAKKENPSISLDVENLPHEELMKKLENCYAVFLPSLNDISPNLILEAVRLGKPFIMTMHTGLYPRLKDVGLFVDPLNIEDIKEKILFLANENNYQIYKDKIEKFSFVHSYQDIAKEFLEVYIKI